LKQAALTDKRIKLEFDQTVQSRRIRLPGFGIGLDYMPKSRFPTAVLDWQASFLAVRELCMLNFVEQITNKPEWPRKVSDEAIVARWKDEALNCDWEDIGIRYGDFSKKMFKYVWLTRCQLRVSTLTNLSQSILELREKAKFHERTGMTIVFDNDACVVKSDVSVPSTLKNAIKKAVEPLENVPNDEKDWHPGSDGKVLDLVHPSLFPLVYGSSRTLPQGTINLTHTLDTCGGGEIIPIPTDWGVLEDDSDEAIIDSDLWSSRFQWLPCDVEFPDGKTAKIISYINNLHPARHSGLYAIIEKFISKAVPLWHIVWRWTTDGFKRERIDGSIGVQRKCTVPEICGRPPYGCSPLKRPLPNGETDFSYYTSDEKEKWYDETEKWYDETHPVIRPEPKVEYEPLEFTYSPEDIIGEGGLLHASNNKLQVIIKLANIHLTPENRKYDGGSWHIEGQLNEHICATALYYYDSENITDSYLAFRTCVDSGGGRANISYEQGDFDPIDLLYNALNGEPAIQERGRVLTREGRLLAFPNVFQHAVLPFQLADPTKPGHRKILALFLVDPAVRVLSTANVPPQQKEWWTERFVKNGWFKKLPPELTKAVLDEVDFPFDLETAKFLRQELMDERSNIQAEVDDRLKEATWNFCEH